MKKHLHHIHIYILSGLLALVVLFSLAIFLAESSFLRRPTTFGVSFSPEFATELGLNPRETYQDLLTDLKVKNLRLNAYWNEIEPQPDQFDFEELDWYIGQASLNQASVILTVGYKLPRWPECRAPKWLPENKTIRQERQLIMVQKVIEHYDRNPTVTAFQIENEPLLNFGICPAPDPHFFLEEIKMVRKLTTKPILVTDSGELRTWIDPMQQSDIFGTTLYRKVNNPIVGDFFYPLPPAFYRLKAGLVKNIFASNNQKVIIAELQSELWAGQFLDEIPVETQVRRFSLNQFKETVHYARRTGFKEIYLWGAEWWYYLAAKNHPEYLEYAKGLF